MSVEFEHLGGGKFLVSGRLTFATVTDALAISKRLFPGHERVDVDLQGVQGGDSAGLALLIEWVSEAHRMGVEIVFRNVPEQLLAIGRICEVDGMLPVVPAA